MIIEVDQKPTSEKMYDILIRELAIADAYNAKIKLRVKLLEAKHKRNNI